MISINNNRLSKAVRVYLDILLLLGFIGSLVLAAWLLISPWIMSRNQTPLDASIPVALGSRSIRPIIHLETTSQTDQYIQSPIIVDARGELRFLTSSWRLHFVSNIVYLIALLIVMYIIYLTRSILHEVVKGNPFGEKNAKRIRGIGLLILVVGILGPLAEYFSARFVLARLTTTNPALSAPLSFNSDAVLAGLLILILSQIWRYGAELAHEQALTI